jgi:hypothetical protein
MAAPDFSLSSFTIEAEISVTELISYRTSCLVSWNIGNFFGRLKRLKTGATAERTSHKRGRPGLSDLLLGLAFGWHSGFGWGSFGFLAGYRNGAD